VMPLLEDFGVTWREVGAILIGGTGIYLAALASIRISGLRSMSKMSAFDFVVTIAVGAGGGGAAPRPPGPAPARRRRGGGLGGGRGV
jgi:hypothetical protein